MNTNLRRSTPAVDDVGGYPVVTPHIQDVDDAAYTLAHSFPGGVPALAQRMGMSRNTLQSKVNLNLDTHRLSLRESVQMQAVSGDCRVLHAMAAALDHVALPAPSMDEGGMGMMLAQVGAEVGDVFREVQRALSDKHVTPNERRKVADQVAKAMSALACILKVL